MWGVIITHRGLVGAACLPQSGLSITHAVYRRDGKARSGLGSEHGHTHVLEPKELTCRDPGNQPWGVAGGLLPVGASWKRRSPLCTVLMCF